MAADLPGRSPQPTPDSSAQDGTLPRCAAHPSVTTRLTCASCGTPICPRCMVATPVGQKCPACARQRGRARGNPPPALLARVAGASVAAGVAGAFLLFFVFGRFGGILLAVLYGLAAGAAAGAAARNRRHPWVGATAAAGLVAGVAATLLVLGASPLAPQALLLYLVGGGVTYLRASGTW